MSDEHTPGFIDTAVASVSSAVAALALVETETVPEVSTPPEAEET